MIVTVARCHSTEKAHTLQTTPSTSLTRSLAVLATAGLVLTGCSSEDIAERVAEEAAEQAGGGEVDIDTDDGSVSVDTDEGSLNIGSQDLPEDLPEELPLPDGLAVQGSMSQQGDGGSTVGFQATYDGSFEDVEAFFDAELEDAGWTVTNSTSSETSGVRSASWQVEGFGHTGIVLITQLREDENGDRMAAVSVNLESTDDASS